MKNISKLLSLFSTTVLSKFQYVTRTYSFFENKSCRTVVFIFSALHAQELFIAVKYKD